MQRRNNRGNLRLILIFKELRSASIALFCILIASSSNADVPRVLEPDFAEAVIDFNTGKNNEALKRIESLIDQSPRTVEFLELKALILKTTGQKYESAKTYADLIKAKSRDGRPPKESAPYYFELGTIYYQGKKNEAAVSLFKKAIEYKFNIDPAQFLIGLIRFEEGNFTEAESRFSESSGSTIPDLRMASAFYLGQIAFKLKDPLLATTQFQVARKEAQDILDSHDSNPESKVSARKIQEAVDGALAPLNESRFFGNVSAVTGWDSNIQAFPASTTGAEASGKKTLKETLQFGIGYISSANKDFQFIPSYRASYNYNFNQDARSAQYLTHILSTAVNHRPLDPTNYGVKLEGTLIFRNTIDTAAGITELRPYSLTGVFGPYFKTRIARRNTLLVELTGGPSTNYQDNTGTADARRSGPQFMARVTLSRVSGWRLLNPSIALSAALSNTLGPDYRSRSAAAALGNAFQINDRTRANLSLGTTYTLYANRPSGARRDWQHVLAVSTSYQLNPRLTLLADASGTWNRSNVSDTYQYERYTISAGASWSLFNY